MVYSAENYLEGCKPNENVIPNNAFLDEMAFFVMESVEENYNSMMKGIGVAELAHIEENGVEVVYEAGKIKEVIAKAEKMFKDMWEKVQGLIKKALAFFEKKSREFREKVMKKLDDSVLKKRVEGIKNDRAFGTTYAYKDIANYSSTLINDIKSADSDIDKLYTTAASSAKDGNTALLNSLSDDLDAKVKSVISKIAPNANSVSSITKMLKDDIRGERVDVDGAWVKKNYSDIIKEVTDYPVTKKTLKSDYNKLKGCYNDAIKACRKANNDKVFEANAYTKAIKAYKDLRHITISCQQAIISCFDEQQNFYKSVIIKIIGSKPVKESAVSESTTVDKVSSLFEW